MSKVSVEDRLAIRELVDAFSAAVIRIDPQAFAATFTQDGAWILPSVPEGSHGREEISKVFAEKLSYVEHIHMIGFPEKLEVDGDKAVGTVMCKEQIYIKDGGGEKHLIGCFTDEYEKHDGQWLFKKRDYEIIGLH